MNPLHLTPVATPREHALLHDLARQQALALRQQAIDQALRAAARGLRRLGRLAAHSLHQAGRRLQRPARTDAPCARPALEA